jgi:hypothetical protein
MCNKGYKCEVTWLTPQDSHRSDIFTSNTARCTMLIEQAAFQRTRGTRPSRRLGSYGIAPGASAVRTTFFLSMR